MQSIYVSAPYFLKQCHRNDPNINICLKQSANYLVANMRRGIPELGITEPEPIIIDEIGIALGSGPDGYRASFRNIHAYGVSNITVTGVRYAIIPSRSVWIYLYYLHFDLGSNC
jgi:hypothetical protein